MNETCRVKKIKNEILDNKTCDRREIVNGINVLLRDVRGVCVCVVSGGEKNCVESGGASTTVRLHIKYETKQKPGPRPGRRPRRRAQNAETGAVRTSRRPPPGGPVPVPRSVTERRAAVDDVRTGGAPSPTSTRAAGTRGRPGPEQNAIPAPGVACGGAGSCK